MTEGTGILADDAYAISTLWTAVAQAARDLEHSTRGQGDSLAI